MRDRFLALKSVRGKVTIVRTPTPDTEEMSRLKLHGAKRNGIWIKSQASIDAGVQKCKLTILTAMLLLFVPFHSIEDIIGFIDALFEAAPSTSVEENLSW